MFPRPNVHISFYKVIHKILPSKTILHSLRIRFTHVDLNLDLEGSRDDEGEGSRNIPLRRGGMICTHGSETMKEREVTKGTERGDKREGNHKGHRGNTGDESNGDKVREVRER